MKKNPEKRKSILIRMPSELFNKIEKEVSPNKRNKKIVDILTRHFIYDDKLSDDIIQKISELDMIMYNITVFLAFDESKTNEYFKTTKNNNKDLLKKYVKGKLSRWDVIYTAINREKQKVIQ